jgi:hypothetical protein
MKSVALLPLHEPPSSPEDRRKKDAGPGLRLDRGRHEGGAAPGTQHEQPGERLTTRSISQEIEESSLQMIGYMNLEEQADRNFCLARRKATLRRIGARLRGDAASNRSLCFDEVRKSSGAVGGLRRGRKAVPLGQITGSAGRCSDFDRAFLPARPSVSQRWKRIDKAFHRAEEFPPVSLYKIGESYFVLDGNHRVSVYRYHGVEWVDADVTAFRGLLPMDRKVEGRNKSIATRALARREEERRCKRS